MPRILIVLSFILFVFSACSQTYYIVRHAEKATQEPNMSSDVPLSETGKERAKALGEMLKKEKIGYIFSTNTIRTKSTAQPTADHFQLSIEAYGPRPDSAFIELLKSKNKNTLIVGHSNTVDDIVNKLCGSTQIAADLNDSEYDNLFIVTKEGGKYVLTKRKYGASSGN